MTPTFTVLIGSAGRPSLTHTLDSIKRQSLVRGDQVIVALDSHGRGEMPDVQAMVKRYGFDVCAYDAGYNFCGVEQINFALRTLPLSGTRILTLGDDDVFVDGMYAALRPICQDFDGRAALFRMVDIPPYRRILWDKPRMKMSWISGCCIAAPVQHVPQMPRNRTWPDGVTPFVEHDFFWMQRIIEQSQHDPVWVDHVMVIARPDSRGDDVVHQGVIRCWSCKAWRWREDVPAFETHCPKCLEPIPLQEYRQIHAGSSYAGERTAVVH